MKKLFFTLLICSAVTAASQAQVRVGPFLGYGDDLNLWGLGVYSEIMLNDRVSISPIFTQYFPEKLGKIPRRTVWELNTNVNYYVVRGDVGYLYGLSGVNYTHFRVKSGTVSGGEQVDKDGNLGLNIGLGTMVRINDLVVPFAEARYTLGGYSQFALIFGVKFQLGDGNLDDDY